MELEVKIKELTAKLADEVTLKERFKLNYESTQSKISELEASIKKDEEIRVCHCSYDNERKKVFRI